MKEIFGWACSLERAHVIEKLRVNILSRVKRLSPKGEPATVFAVILNWQICCNQEGGMLSRTLPGTEAVQS